MPYAATINIIQVDLTLAACQLRWQPAESGRPAPSFDRYHLKLNYQCVIAYSGGRSWGFSAQIDPDQFAGTRIGYI